VKDKEKVFVSKWGLKDDSVNLVVFDKEGKVAYLHLGPVPDSEFPKVIKTIRDAMAK
jgi:predicted transcriptional regulator